MAAVEVPRKPVQAPPAPPVQGEVSVRSPRVLELAGHVGFDSLPDQLVLKAQLQGFTFNLLCVGETGIGKSTLMESLFNMQFKSEPCGFELGTVELRSHQYEINESNVRLKLTIVETAGFGDQLDKDKSTQVIIDYIDKQYEQYLQEELKIKRHMSTYNDTRIHACLYFISPTGHGLKDLDKTVLKVLHSRVNIIPVIAKADTIGKDGLILSGFNDLKVETYVFPTDDETVAEINKKLNGVVPFAVVGSTDFAKLDNGKKVRARQYPWGVVEVEKEEHCDFVQLREALLRTNVEDLRERTHSILYERYRRERLVKLGYKEGELGHGLQQTVQRKREEHAAELKRMEEDMKQRFVVLVKKREDELKNQEAALKAREDSLKKEFEAETAKLNEEERKLNEEIAAFRQQQANFTNKKGNKK